MNNPTGVIIYVVGLMLVFYLLFILPQKKQQKKRAEVMEQLKVGDEIVTIGGLMGRLTQMDGQIIKVDVGNGMELTFLKTAIAGPKNALIKEGDDEEVNIDDLEDYMDDADDADDSQK